MADGTIPTGALGFRPDPEAWARYGAAVEATLRLLSDAAGSIAPDADPRPIAPATAPSGAGTPDGYGERGWGDLCDVAGRLRAGSLAPSELVAESLARIARHDGALRAFVAVEADRATAEARRLDGLAPAARGPLAGAPYARKDLFYRAGMPAACGAPIYASHVPTTTATVVERLDAAGGIDLGRLAMAELALSPTGFNAHEPHPRNPWNPAHVPGGSSSGSGIAVSAGYVALALGTDTGGSIRFPAAACGITGIKPTRGRVSRAGGWPLSWTLDTMGPLARSARDCALALEIIAGPDPRDGTVPSTAAFRAPAMTGDLSGVRIAVPGAYYAERVTPAVAAALAGVRRTLEDLGATLVDTTPPDMALVNAATLLVMSVEAAAQLAPHLVGSGDAIGRQVRDRIEPGLLYPAAHYANALRLVAPARAAWLAAAMADCDAALMPAYPREVPTIAETTEPDLAAIGATLGDLTHTSRAMNFFGLPALAAPCGVDGNGCPIAFQLAGRPFEEGRILSIADAYQRATDWHLRRPPLA
mgnify:CR=1 FL=1